MKYLYIIALGLFFVNGGCRRDNAAMSGNCNLENIVKSAANTKGIISYDTQSQRYAVFSGIDGTYDSQDIGIACNLPDNYKIEGLNVLFSGNYYKCDEFSPLIPGQTYYYLDITKIESLGSK